MANAADPPSPINYSSAAQAFRVEVRDWLGEHAPEELRGLRVGTQPPRTTSRFVAASDSPGSTTPTCYFKRAKTSQLMFGDTGAYRRRVADRIGL